MDANPPDTAPLGLAAASAATVSTSGPTPAEAAKAGPGLALLLAGAKRLAAEPGLVDRLATEPDQRTWLPLDAGPDMQAWLIAWPPGTGTGWHDHGGASGAMVAVAGELTERSVHVPPGHTFGEPLPLPGGEGSVRTLRAGAGRAFDERHVHEVTNEGRVAAYSVHVYAPDLPLMRHYAASGESLVFVGWEAVQDW